jgi:hypothetical protein
LAPSNVTRREEGQESKGDERLSLERMQLVSGCFPCASPELKRQGRLSAACQKFFRYLENLERAKGFEPSTPTLARSCSCFNALPHVIGAVYKKRAGYSADITMTQ